MPCSKRNPFPDPAPAYRQRWATAAGCSTSCSFPFCSTPMAASP
uniref:Uncharacterized protein n=1 Tax=Arundo donax TaxID=35708 RepID=A0A0A8ZEA2_ARUDO